MQRRSPAIGCVTTSAGYEVRPSVTTPADSKSLPLDAFHALLPTLASTLDVNEVFQHLAAIAAGIIPHDEANLAILTEGGTQFHEYRKPSPADPAHGPECPLRNLHAPQVVNDLRSGPYRAGVSAPVRINDRPLG